MTISTKKNLGWLALFFALGGVAVFWINNLIEPATATPFPLFWGFWHLLLLGTVPFLRYCYRQEPMPPLGLWQLRMQDLFSATVLAGLLLAMYRAVKPDMFIPTGIILSIGGGLVFVLGLLIAARKGHSQTKLKYLYAFGHSALVIGAIGWAALLSIIGINHMAWFTTASPTMLANMSYPKIIWSLADNTFELIKFFLWAGAEFEWSNTLMRFACYHLPGSLILFAVFKFAQKSTQSVTSAAQPEKTSAAKV